VYITPYTAMYSLKVASIFAMLALSSLGSASCNSGGQKADDATMQAAQQNAQLEVICSSLVGDYFGKEERSTCIQIGNGKYDFTLRRKGSSNRHIAMKECKDGMLKELMCARGGKTGYGNWWYRYVSLGVRFHCSIC
jgi:hypothetical protein